MKRLGFFVSITLVLVAFFAAFPSTTYAQGIDRLPTSPAIPGNLTLSDYQQRGDALFAKQLDALAEVKANPQKAGTIPPSPTDVDKLMPVIIQARALFNTTLTAGANDPKKGYEQALFAASASISEQQRVQGLRTPYQTNVIRLFTKQLEEEALAARKEVALVQGGYTAEEAARNTSNVQTQNATAVTAATAGQKADPKVDNCNLMNGNLLGCIDQLITFIIKNTLLRLAGVILWVCANMLNFAMNVGVLDFSKWASTGELYGIWIVVRQIVSLAVVFAGLWLGFMYIIGREDTFGKYIGWVIIFALFVNFSYPISRALVDVSNIVSLNVYSVAVPGGLGSTTAQSAGDIIMEKIGLQQLVSFSTGGAGSETFNKIDTTAVALITVVFVAYAAYVFFMATAIIAVRTAVLVFLIVGSPFLLVDAVVPKLGEVAAKMRKMYFEQLAVAPVFTIMLALTLKFMDVFKFSTTPLTASAGNGNVGMFFNTLMMLIMLHIMLKVTRSLAGDAGSYATNVMGKVGGFGLAAATGGAGLLARGTIGQAALKARDSGWMDKMKDTKMGRGLYGLSNSLAQSTYDARNIGMVSKGLATAGLTGGLGLGMQSGAKRGFEQVSKDREERVLKFGSNIKNDKTRDSYFDKANRGFVYSKIDEAKLEGAKGAAREARRVEEDKKISALGTFVGADEKKRSSLLDQSSGDLELQKKMKVANQYLTVDNVNDPSAVAKKVEQLIKLDDSDMAKKVIDNDPFADITEAYEKEIKKEEEELELMQNKDAEVNLAGPNGLIKTTKYKYKKREIEQKKAEHKKKIEDKRRELLEAYKNRNNEITHGPVEHVLPDDTPPPDAGSAVPVTDINPHPGGSDMSRYGGKEYEIPAYERKRQAEINNTFPPKPLFVEQNVPTEQQGSVVEPRLMTEKEMQSMQDRFNIPSVTPSSVSGQAPVDRSVRRVIEGSGAEPRLMTDKEVEEMQSDFNVFSQSFSEHMKGKGGGDDPDSLSPIVPKAPEPKTPSPQRVDIAI